MQQVPSSFWRCKQINSSSEPPEGTQLCPCLDFCLCDPFQTSDVQNCNIINLYCFKPLSLWPFVTAAVANWYSILIRTLSIKSESNTNKIKDKQGFIGSRNWDVSRWSCLPKWLKPCHQENLSLLLLTLLLFQGLAFPPRADRLPTSRKQQSMYLPAVPGLYHYACNHPESVSLFLSVTVSQLPQEGSNWLFLGHIPTSCTNLDSLGHGKL